MKIGISSYLNTLPLSYALQTKIIQANFEIIYALPNECSDLLREKQIDAALIPSIEYARFNDDLFILDGFCIGAMEYVKSVSLFFNQNLKDIQRVAVDESSRTSVILSKILLEEKYEIFPEYIQSNNHLETMLKQADAALIIGDKALYLHDSHPNKMDLAEEWYDMCGEGFVFAFIAGYENSITNEIAQILKSSLEYGLNHITEMAEYWHKNNPQLSADTYKNYLSQNIVFDFNNDLKRGLNLFYDYAFLRGYIDYFPEIKFFKYEETAL